MFSVKKNTNWFQTQHQDQITSVSASINMTKLSLQMYKLTLYFSSSCIYESGGGICLTRAWPVLGVGLLWSLWVSSTSGYSVIIQAIIASMEVKLGNSLLLLYQHEVFVNICHECESRPPSLWFLVQCGGPGPAAAQTTAPGCSPRGDWGQFGSWWTRVLI